MRVLLFLTIFALALLGTLAWKLWPELSRPTRLDPAFQVPLPFELASLVLLGAMIGAVVLSRKEIKE